MMSYQEDSSSKNGIVRGQKNKTDSTKGEAWSPSYLKLGCSFSFPNFVISIIRSGLVA
jgi:hypothetical protein